MRNMLVALGIVLAGFSSRLANQTAASPDELREPQEPRRGAHYNPWFGADHPLGVLYGYLATIPGGEAENQFREPEDPFVPCPALPRSGQDVRFLIATVFDPAATNLNLFFDRQLEAIVAAAQDSGYFYQDHWLPWRQEPANAGGSLEDERAREHERLLRESLPGLLLFRRPVPQKQEEQGREDQTLAVLLVGETPTGGISAEQFQRAACYVTSIQRAGDSGPLGILGPTSSASFESLHHALQRADATCQGCFSNKRIRSGTTTSAALIQDFQDRKYDFRTTLHNDSWALDMLKQSGLIAAKRIIYLAEGDTAFGGSISSPGQSQEQVPAGAGQDSGKQAANQQAGASGIKEEKIYYPREISRLRNAYQQDPALRAQPLPDLQGGRSQLQTSLRDTSTSENIHQFSPQTTVTQETVLFHIAERLHQSQAQLAVVTGTNVLDALFLSRFIRQTAPDVRVLLPDADLLFVHGTDSLDYLGLLSLTTYPLIPDLTPASGIVRRDFASNTQEGIYNAGVWLLRDLFESKNQFNPRDYSLPEFGWNDQPPLWLTVVGRGAYWPVAAVKQTAASPQEGKQGNAIRKTPESGAPASLKISVQPPTRVWKTVLVTATVLIFLYLRNFRHSRQWDRRQGRIPPGQRQYFLAAAVFLGAAYGSLSFATLQLALIADSLLWPLLLAVAGTTMVALAFAAGRTAWRLKLRIYTAVFAGGAALWFLLPLWIHTSEPERLFYAVRAVNPESGVAPNLPLVFLMLALAWYAWVNWRRANFTADLDAGVPELRGEMYSLPAANIEPLRRVLNQVWLHGDGVGVLAAAVAVAITAATADQLHSLEPPPYDAILLVLVAATMAALLSGAWGLVEIWRRLRQFLRPLEAHPLQKDLARLPPPPKGSSLWRGPGESTKRTLGALGTVIRSLQTLRESGEKEYYPGLQKDLDELVSQLHTGALPADQQDAAHFQGRVRANRIAGLLGQQLRERLWLAGPASGKDAYAHQVAGKIVALRYLSFIRYAVLQIRNQVTFLTVGFLLAAAALNVYPFQGAGYIRWWTIVMFLLVGAAVTWVLVHAHSDPLLKQITATNKDKDEVDWSAYTRLAAAGILPLLAMLGVLFPSVGRFLFSWVQPSLSALN